MRAGIAGAGILMGAANRPYQLRYHGASEAVQNLFRTAGAGGGSAG